MAQFKIALRRYVLIEADNFEEAIKIAKANHEEYEGDIEVNYEESLFLCTEDLD